MILFLAYTEADGSLSRSALEVLSASKSQGPFSVGLIGADTQKAANQIATCGAAKFYAVTGEVFGPSRYSTDAAAAEAICRAAGATIVMAPQNSRTARSLPGVARRLGAAVDTHITAVSQALEVSRWYYRQRMEGVLTRTERPWVLLLESGCAVAWTGDSGTAAVDAVTVEITAALSRTTVVGKQSPRSEQQTIRPDAPLLFVAGAGWTKKQKDGLPHVDVAAKLILGFINTANASLGSSKSLVDLSGEGEAILPFLSHLNQVGQTGSTPRHAKGLATCCHGEEPHVVGWRFIGERRAINLDANCGWARGKADVLYVADAFEVITRVNALLAQSHLATEAATASA